MIQTNQELIDANTAVTTIYTMIDAIDRKDWVACRSTFADQIYLDLDFSADGPHQVKADEMITSWRKLFEQFATTLHIVTNPRVELDGKQAIVHSYVTALHVGKDGLHSTNQSTAYGIYEHRLTKIKGEWKITYMLYRNRMRFNNIKDPIS